ncbi:MAG: hypothetical protein O3A31_07665 [Planctomycetota bacterium]|nr:hypothetical protein [Planctomycetota bacterium]
MNPIWPCFHDPAYRPTHLERLDIHWKANLRMLRFPRDLGLFTVISLIPLLLLLLVAEWFPGPFQSGTATPRAPWVELESIVPAFVLLVLVFLVLQHLAFVTAMNLTYLHHVRAVLRDRGIPLCEQCGQLLSPDRPESACPECGHRRLATTLIDLVPRMNSRPLGHPSQDAAANHPQNGIRR